MSGINILALEMETNSDYSEPQQMAPSPNASSQVSSVKATHGGSADVQVVVVQCEGEKPDHGPWSATTIPANHATFSEPVLPIPSLIEVPLVLYRVGTQSDNRPALLNQIATYLRIEPVSGFAPPGWQSHVGTVLVARKDKKPLLPHHLEGVWMYCSHILDHFGRGQGAPQWLYNRRAFEQWWLDYSLSQSCTRLGEGGKNDVDDWRNVKSPYDV